MLNVETLSVRVVSVNRDPVSGARVSLIPERKGSKSITLDWNENANLYSAELTTHGIFTLEVSAPGFDGQKRVIKVPHPATVEEFVLGKEGMPFYYRGRVKTPFEPKLDLVGITIKRGTDEGRKHVLALCKRLKLSEVKISDQIRNNNVLIFRHNSGASDEDRQNVLETLLGDEGVQLAGPVVELFGERAVYLTSQLLVKFRPNVTSELAEEYGKKCNLRVVRAVRYAGNAYLYEAQPKADYSLLQTAAALTELDDVEYAEPNSVTTSMLYAVNPKDFLVAQQWHIPLISLPAAWQALRDENTAGLAPGQAGDLTYGGENVVIAVADLGIESSTMDGVTTPLHPDFSGTVTGGAPKVASLYDFINMVPNNDAVWHDHGMGCAGVAAAQTDNAASVVGETEGVAGAAGNCQVIGMMVPFGHTNQRWADALVWMAGLDPGWTADGLNYPVGTEFPAPPAPGASIHTNSTRIPDVGLLDDTLDYLATYGRGGKGVISFLAAGNTAANISHPDNNTIADHDKVITVAASTNTDVRSGYSCFDAAIDICAPSSGDFAQTNAGALGIVTTDTVGGGNLPGHAFGTLDYRNNFGGTSSATPLAAGVAALMLSINPDLTWTEVHRHMRETAKRIDAQNNDPIGRWVDIDGDGIPEFSQWYGYGRIDAYRAVKAAMPQKAAAPELIRSVEWTRHRHTVAVLEADRKSLVPLHRQTALDRVEVGSLPMGMAFDGRHVWVAHSGNDYLSKIDILNNTVVATVTVGDGPTGLVFDGTHIWVSNMADNSVSKVRSIDNVVEATIPVGRAPKGLAFDGSHIWVANHEGDGSNDLSKIDIATGAVIATVGLGWQAANGGTEELAFDGTHIWVSLSVPYQWDKSIFKIDIVSNSVIASLPLFTASYPYQFTAGQLAFDGTNVWVADYFHNNVKKIDTNTNTIVDSVDVGRRPYSVIFDGTHIWVGNHHGHNVTKIDVETNAVVRTVGVGHNPGGMVFDSTHLWVASHNMQSKGRHAYNVCKLPVIPIGTETPSGCM